MEINPYMETFTGVHHHLNDQVFNIEDIANSLGMLCRFNGHCSDFYSVAEHSVLVSDIMEFLDLGDPFEGLMHDACEAYLGDVVAPYKVHFRDFMRWENWVDGEIRKEFFLPVEKTPECTIADMLALKLEAKHLVKSRGMGWKLPVSIDQYWPDVESKFQIFCLDPKSAKKLFLEYYEEWEGSLEQPVDM